MPNVSPVIEHQIPVTKEAKVNWIVAKLKEGSTWAGIAGIVAGASFIPHADEISKIIPSLGVVVAGLLAIWFP